MVVDDVLVTWRWVTGNVTVRADPVRMALTEAGTVATVGLELLNWTTVPEAGVGPLKVRVPVIVV